jgi:hypothetical protein
MTRGPGPYDPQPTPPNIEPNPVLPGHNPTEVPVQQPTEIPATDPDRAPEGPSVNPEPTPDNPGPRA